MDKGIVLMCYGNKAYGKYAYNMAHSIRHYSDIPIHLLCDHESTSGIDMSVCTSIAFIEPSRRSDGQYDHALNKINVFKHSPFERTIFLDVDGIVLKDILPLFDTLGQDHFIYAQTIGSGHRMDRIPYTVWADNETTWNHFRLKDEDILPAVQTSILYFDKSEKAKEFFDKLRENYKTPLSEKDYKNMWGKTKNHPDELYFSGTMAQMGILPFEKEQPIFFPHAKEKTSVIFDNYYVLSQYGAFGLVRPYAIDLYDRHMSAIMSSKKLNHHYKANNLYKNKFSAHK